MTSIKQIKPKLTIHSNIYFAIFIIVSTCAIAPKPLSPQIKTFSTVGSIITYSLL